MTRTLVWFRGKDLRTHDHEPLLHAIEAGDVIPLFVLDPYFFAKERASKIPHRMQFLLESIESLSLNLAHLGSELVVVRGKSIEVIPKIATALRVTRVVAHRWTEPFARERDNRIEAALSVPFELYEGETLRPPGALRTGSGTPYAVFTPFCRAFEAAEAIRPALAAPELVPPVPKSTWDRLEAAGFQRAQLPTLEELGIERNPLIQRGGERAARDRMKSFLRERVDRYDSERDRMDLASTSRLSADLKFGTLSVRTLWNALMQTKTSTSSRTKYARELIWREFTHATLHARPSVSTRPFRSDFEGFPWRSDPQNPDFLAWQKGLTGYPIVDAASRQLLAEGFVHNRARMIAASFLTKHLLVDYKLGESHYLAYLTDGDWAQNNAGWQWSAGCGCDAQPYFRVFNPITQGEKFDPMGDYVRRWVPELRDLDAKHIHAPFDAPDAVLSRAGVTLGTTYPRPIVDHAEARKRFLDTASKHLQAVRESTATPRD
ncbi:MAG: deoxyribodipyrimidine photo-lyase [Polyangiaceae bacterium]